MRYDPNMKQQLKSLLENSLKSKRSVNDYLREFDAFIKSMDVDLDDIDLATCSEYFEVLKSRNAYSLATIEKKFSILNRIFNMLMKNELLAENYMALLEKPRVSREVPVRKVISYQDLDLLVGGFKELGLRDLCWFLLKLYSCYKIEKLLSLRVKDFNLDADGEGYLVNENNQILHLPKYLVDLIDEMVKHQALLYDDDFIFQGRSYGSHLSSRQARKILRQVCERVGTTEVFLPRDIRHTSVVLLADGGASEHEIMELLGFKEIRSLRSYQRVMRSQSVDVEKLINITIKE